MIRNRHKRCDGKFGLGNDRVRVQYLSIKRHMDYGARFLGVTVQYCFNGSITKPLTIVV